MLFISSQKRKRKFSGTYLKPPFFSKKSKTRVCGGKLNCKQYSTLNNYHIYNNKQLYSHKHSTAFKKSSKKNWKVILQIY